MKETDFDLDVRNLVPYIENIDLDYVFQRCRDINKDQLRLVKNGRILEYKLQDLNLTWITNHKVTIVLDAIDTEDTVLCKLRALLENLLERTVHLNLYFTPPNCQGFSVHSDQHDVLIVQLSGEKYWCIYPKDIESGSFDQSFPFRLKKYEFLRISKSVIHGAFTKAEHSLHLTIGIH
ncbi:JmjC domain-containing protein [Cyclobacterium sp. SYSU L10401]|uniref:JmjC domain-containing protein n=1 Tax=Cyclobacterium sp. SYSU L10401 TaxID=2678657 RepID=UPI0013D795CA|nr:cupin domain-containing protein [Cyclobacterium sp. SYSU L10401]